MTTTLPDEEEFEIPSGAIKFEITEEEIRESLMNYDIEVEAGKDIDVPDDLISDEEIQKLIGIYHKLTNFLFCINFYLFIS